MAWSSTDNLADLCTRILVLAKAGLLAGGRKRSHKFYCWTVLKVKDTVRHTEISDTPEWTQDILGIQVM